MDPGSFDSHPITTATVIAYANLHVDRMKLLDTICVTPYLPLEKRCVCDEESQKCTCSALDSLIPRPGDIVDKSLGKFRNSLSIRVMCENEKGGIRPISCKIYDVGTIHSTGIKSMRSCIKTVQRLCDRYIFPSGAATVFPPVVSFLFHTVMINICYSIGFEIDLDYLNYELYHQSNFVPIWNRNVKYMALKIKEPVVIPQEATFPTTHYTSGSQTWTTGDVSFDEFLSLVPKSKQKAIMKGNRKKKVTVMIFHTGKINMSGPHQVPMRAIYEQLNKFLLKHRSLIELDVQ